MKFFSKVNSQIMKGVNLLLICFGMLLTLTVFINVCSRHFFGSTIPWSEEFARFVFIWVIFIGMVLANDNSEHMRLDFLVEALPKKVSLVVQILANCISIGLLGMLVHGSIRYTVTQWDWMSSALGVRHGVVYMIAPICLSYMVLQFIGKSITLICQLKTKEEKRC